MITNKLRHRLDRTEWAITVVDRDDEHRYQPGYLFVPLARTAATRIDPDESVVLPEGGRRLPYD